jgi:hypothetical protein
MSKPIIRWTIGNVSKEGIDCLKLCVNKIKKFYGEEFDYFICHNKIDKNKIKWANRHKVELVDQVKYEDSLAIKPIRHPCWKLYPPRLNINSYEIFIDNDVVLYKKIDLDKFIKNNYFFMSEAIKKNYGTMQSIINKKPYLNSGFFGMPAGFDFQKEINLTIKKFNIKWGNSHFEEQGVVAHILNKNNCEVIGLEKIYVCSAEQQQDDCYDGIKKSEFGLHFVGLNSGDDLWKSFWMKYKSKLL